MPLDAVDSGAAVQDSVPREVCPDPGRIAVYEAAIAIAFDSSRLNGLCRTWLVEEPVLVATLESTVEACREAAIEARDRPVWPALQAAQVVSRMFASQEGTTTDARPIPPPVCLSSSKAEAFFASLRRRMARGNSFANSTTRSIFVNEGTRLGLSEGRRAGTAPLDTASLAAEWIALHEVGHLRERLGGWRIEAGAFAALPGDLGEAMAKHSRECFADAFAVAALVALGRTPEQAMASWVRRRSWTFSSPSPEEDAPPPRAHPDPVAGSHEQGIYCTLFAASRAARAARAGMSPDRVAHLAWRAARAGALPADWLGRVATVDAWFDLFAACPDWPLVERALDERAAAWWRWSRLPRVRVPASCFEDDCPARSLRRLRACAFALDDLDLRLDPWFEREVTDALWDRVQSLFPGFPRGGLTPGRPESTRRESATSSAPERGVMGAGAIHRPVVPMIMC